ncbi:MAG: class I SAM-dependent methyltransferase [Parvularculaceae bacterium]|nr:class I SAM-dependent methyltransferase [Parvularculaceae bacterium]
MLDRIEPHAKSAKGRHDLIARIWRDFNVRAACEVGVFRGIFAENILTACPDIDQYYMIDPWRHLSNWEKPANRDDDVFNKFLEEAMARTEFAASRRRVLRGTTKEVSAEIPNGSLDAVYIDGDHTLRGIAIDLITMLPKMRIGGIVCGDDFTKNIWQHGTKFAPTEVFPYAVYFAEAQDLPIYTLPYDQFLIVNDPGSGFECRDLAGYMTTPLIEAYTPPSLASRAVNRTKRIFGL